MSIILKMIFNNKTVKNTFLIKELAIFRIIMQIIMIIYFRRFYTKYRSLFQVLKVQNNGAYLNTVLNREEWTWDRNFGAELSQLAV